jgi:predicted TIM-barrel fold metal-dependent hydrolase
VFADTSGVRRFDLLEQAVQRAGPSKFLFGSDGPWLHPAVELAKVKLLNLSLADENLILGENFLRLVSRATARQFRGAALSQTQRRDLNLVESGSTVSV